MFSRRRALLSFAKGIRSFATNASSVSTEGSSGPRRTLWNDPIPFWPRVLGFSGLIPFYGLCPALINSCEDAAPGAIPKAIREKAAALHTSYAISIVSFLGAVHWGTALAGLAYPALWNERLVLGVVPSLLSFPAAALPEETLNPVILSAFAGAFYVDYHFYNQGLLPSWYMRLRIYLTLLAAASFALRSQDGAVRELLNPAPQKK